MFLFVFPFYQGFLLLLVWFLLSYPLWPTAQRRMFSPRIYEAESPDEYALVKAAQAAGYEFKRRATAAHGGCLFGFLGGFEIGESGGERSDVVESLKSNNDILLPVLLFGWLFLLCPYYFGPFEECFIRSRFLEGNPGFQVSADLAEGVCWSSKPCTGPLRFQVVVMHGVLVLEMFSKMLPFWMFSYQIHDDHLLAKTFGCFQRELRKWQWRHSGSAGAFHGDCAGVGGFEKPKNSSGLQVESSIVERSMKGTGFLDSRYHNL